MLGIMSGRLSPPIDNQIQAFPHSTWRDEFPIAKSYGLECLEWVYENGTKDLNPISSTDGINELMRLQQRSGVKINSIVADNFMFDRFFGEKLEALKSQKTLKCLINRASEAGICLLELPLMGKASLKNKNDRMQAVRYLKDIIPYAERRNIILVFELDLEPKAFSLFLTELDSPNIGVNYDMGNSAIFGYDPREEIELLGKYIKNVHIKDGIKNGSTVPLGTGDTDFQLVFSLLEKASYTGDYILQSAREDLAEPIRTIEHTITTYIKYVKQYIS